MHTGTNPFGCCVDPGWMVKSALCCCVFLAQLFGFSILYSVSYTGWWQWRNIIVIEYDRRVVRNPLWLLPWCWLISVICCYYWWTDYYYVIWYDALIVFLFQLSGLFGGSVVLRFSFSCRAVPHSFKFTFFLSVSILFNYLCCLKFNLTSNKLVRWL